MAGLLRFQGSNDMSNRNESLKAYSQRSPVGALQRAGGNWKWSAFCASLVNGTPGDYNIALVSDDAAAINVFLFLQDAPAVVTAEQVYPAVPLTGSDTLAGVVASPGGVENQSSVPFVTDENDVVVSAASGQAVSGYTLTNNVLTDGYAVNIKPTQVSSAGALPAVVSVCVHANAAVVEGRTNFRTTGGNVVESVPCLLLETLYTQDILDAGNLVEDVSSGTVYNVLGLFSVS
jgi:hypothetical protein